MQPEIESNEYSSSKTTGEIAGHNSRLTVGLFPSGPPEIPEGEFPEIPLCSNSREFSTFNFF